MTGSLKEKDVGRIRSRRKFLWLPRRLQGEFRWLRTADVVEEVQAFCHWATGSDGDAMATSYYWVEVGFVSSNALGWTVLRAASEGTGFSIRVDPGDAPVELIAELLLTCNDLYHSKSGYYLKFELEGDTFVAKVIKEKK